MKWFQFAGGGSLLLVATLLVTGCTPERGAPTTITPNPTLAAISQMLTQTRAAPTVTLTPLVTPTQTLTPTPTPLPVGDRQLPGKIGEPVLRDGTSLVVVSATIQPVIGRLKSADNQAFLDVDVLVGNRAAQATDYSPQYFRLTGPDNTQYAPASDAQWPELQSGDLAPGEQVRGHVAFAVPADTAVNDFQLTYQPSGVWVALSQTSAQVPATGSSFAQVEGLAGVGKRVESGGIALTVDQVTTSRKLDLAKPADGNLFVILHVTIENVSHTLSPYNPDYFKVKDAADYEYRPVTIPSENLLQAGGLQRGQKVGGQVVLEVPESDTRLLVKYLPLVLDEKYQEIRLMVDVPAPGK